MSRLVVSTQCPGCGGPLAFAEGSHAVHCSHCGNDLMVTGRRQTLSYLVGAKLDGEAAARAARFAQPADRGFFRLGDRSLHFVPFYRLTAHEYRWQKAANRFESNPLAVTMFRHDPQIPNIQPAPVPLPDHKLVEFHDRHFERSFLALDLPELGIWSLGVKTSVVQLQLFRKDTVKALRGHAVKPTLSAERAMKTALETADAQRILARTLLTDDLSIVYYPYWAIDVLRPSGRSVAVIDAVSSCVVRDNAPDTLRRAFAQDAGLEAQTVGFRPLRCPNCANPFPVKPEDVTFHCLPCDTVWMIHGRDFERIEHDVAAWPEGVAAPGNRELLYLPFWTAIGRDRDDKRHEMTLPAFRYRRLKHLAELARRLTEAAPEWTPLPRSQRPPLPGCGHDARDAEAFAQFLYAGMHRQSQNRLRQATRAGFEVESTRLVWRPLVTENYNLIEPVTGMSLVRSLLL